MTIGMSGDQTWSLMFHHTTSKLKHALTQGSQDLASGEIGNLAAHNRPALSKVAYLDTVAAQTSAFETVLNDQRMFLNHASDSLGFLQHSGRQFGEDMLALNQSATTHIVPQIIEKAHVLIDQSLTTLQMSFVDQSVFAHDFSNMTADELIENFKSDVPLGQNITDQKQAISDWVDTFFADVVPIERTTIIGEGVTLKYDSHTAIDGIKAVISSALLASFVDEATDIQAITNSVGETALTAANKLTQAQADIGLKQEHIEQQSVWLSAHDFALRYERTELTQTDIEKTAINVQETENQLERIYLLTARLSKLNLTDYL